MGRCDPDPRLAKIHRTYAIDEIARLYDVHRNTVRAWIKAGLKAIDDRRPLLVQGAVLAEFLRARRKARRRPCGPAEIYCVRCRQPRRPAGGAVEYRVMTPKGGNLVGTCPACRAGLFRRVASARLAEVLGDLRIAPMEHQQHIAERPSPSVNCDFDQRVPNDEKPPR